MLVQTLFAQRYAATFSHGRSLPMLIEAEAPDGTRHEVVLKLNEPGRVSAAGLVAELVSSFLARDLGLNAPEPFVVEITPEFAASVPDAAAKARLLAAPGLHFASRHVTGQFHLPLAAPHLPAAAVDAAAAVLAFDLLIGNDDRHRDKPNCLVRGSEVVIIDHERAFPILRQELVPNAWEAGGRKAIGRHVFYEALRGQMPGFHDLEATLATLYEPRLDDYLAAIPSAWRDEQALRRLSGFLLDLKRHHAKVILWIKEELR